VGVPSSLSPPSVDPALFESLSPFPTFLDQRRVPYLSSEYESPPPPSFPCLAFSDLFLRNFPPRFFYFGYVVLGRVDSSFPFGVSRFARACVVFFSLNCVLNVTVDESFFPLSLCAIQRAPPPPPSAPSRFCAFHPAFWDIQPPGFSFSQSRGLTRASLVGYPFSGNWSPLPPFLAGRFAPFSQLFGLRYFIPFPVLVAGGILAFPLCRLVFFLPTSLFFIRVFLRSSAICQPPFAFLQGFALSRNQLFLEFFFTRSLRKLVGAARSSFRLHFMQRLRFFSPSFLGYVW